MQLVLTFVIYEGLRRQKSKCGPTDRADHFLSNGKVSNLQTSYCTELEQLMQMPSELGVRTTSCLHEQVHISLLYAL